MTEPHGQVPRPNDTRPPRLPAGTVPALPPTSAGLSEPPIVSAGRVRWTFGPGSAAPRRVVNRPGIDGGLPPAVGPGTDVDVPAPHPRPL